MNRISIGQLMHASWSAACGDDLDLSAFEAIQFADAASPAIQAQIAIALGWMGHAYREASVAATADGECTLTTEWAADRAADIAIAIHRLEAVAQRGRRHTASFA